MGASCCHQQNAVANPINTAFQSSLNTPLINDLYMSLPESKLLSIPVQREMDVKSLPFFAQILLLWS
jgi:hypothetical protein